MCTGILYMCWLFVDDESETTETDCYESHNNKNLMENK